MEGMRLTNSTGDCEVGVGTRSVRTSSLSFCDRRIERRCDTYHTWWGFKARYDLARTSCSHSLPVRNWQDHARARIRYRCEYVAEVEPRSNCPHRAEISREAISAISIKGPWLKIPRICKPHAAVRNTVLPNTGIVILVSPHPALERPVSVFAPWCKGENRDDWSTPRVINCMLPHISTAVQQ